MLAVGVVADFAVEADAAAKEKGAAGGAPPGAFDVNAFLVSVLDRELAEGAANEHAGNAILRGRALWVAARLGRLGEGLGGGGACGRRSARRAERVERLCASAPAARSRNGAGGAGEALGRGSARCTRGWAGSWRHTSGPGRLKAKRLRARGETRELVRPSPATTTTTTLHLVLEAMLVVVKADEEAAAAGVARARAGDAQALVGARRGRSMLRGGTARDVEPRRSPTCPPACRCSSWRCRRSPAWRARRRRSQPMLVESALDVLCVLLRPAPCGGEEARACHAACFGAVARLAATRTTSACCRAPPCPPVRGGGEASLRWGADGAGNGDVLRAYLDARGAFAVTRHRGGRGVRRAPAGADAAPAPQSDGAGVAGGGGGRWCAARATPSSPTSCGGARRPVLARLASSDVDALVAMLAARRRRRSPGSAPTRDGRRDVFAHDVAREVGERRHGSRSRATCRAPSTRVTVTALATLLASDVDRAGARRRGRARRPSAVVADARNAPRTCARARPPASGRTSAPRQRPRRCSLRPGGCRYWRRATVAALGDEDDDSGRTKTRKVTTAKATS